MGETTIRVSDEFREWVKAHKRDGETMEETLRRLTRGPHPSDVAGLLSTEEAEELKAVTKRRRAGDDERKRRAREAFSTDE